MNIVSLLHLKSIAFLGVSSVASIRLSPLASLDALGIGEHRYVELPLPADSADSESCPREMARRNGWCPKERR